MSGVSQISAAGSRGLSVRCGVKGCGALALDGDRYCMRCQDEIDALNRAYTAQEIASAMPTIARFLRTARFVRKWIWLPLALVVAGALIFVGGAFAEMFIEWIRQGSAQ